MRHTALLALSVTLLMALPLAAQSPAPTNGAAVEKSLLGTWEGPYQSEQSPPGGLRLVIGKEDGKWKVTMAVLSDQDIPAGEISDFKVTGKIISWSQEIMGMTCNATAELVSGTLKGESSCEQGGAVAITATWVLLKS